MSAVADEVHISLDATQRIIRFIDEVVKNGKSIMSCPIAGVNLACLFYISDERLKRQRSSGFLSRLMWGGGVTQGAEEDAARYIDSVEQSTCKDDTVYATITVDNLEIARVWNDKLFLELPDPMTEYLYMTLNGVALRCAAVETVNDSSFLKFTSSWLERAINLRLVGQQKLYFRFYVGGKKIVNIDTTIDAKSFQSHCQKLGTNKGDAVQDSKSWSTHLEIKEKTREECQKEQQMYKHRVLKLRGAGGWRRRRDCVVGHEGSRNHVCINFDTSDLRPEHEAAVRVEVYIPFNAKNMAMCFSRYQAACLREASTIVPQDKDGGLSLDQISKGVYCPGHWTIYSRVINKLIAILIPEGQTRSAIRAVRPLALGVMTISDSSITFKQYIDPEAPLYESMERERGSGVTTEVIQRPQEKIMWEYPNQTYLPYTRGMQMAIPNGAWDAHTFYVVNLDEIVRHNGVATYSSVEDEATLAVLIARRNGVVAQEEERKRAGSRTCLPCYMSTLLSSTSVPVVDDEEEEHL